MQSKRIITKKTENECKSDIEKLKHNVEDVDNFVDNLKGGVKYGEFSKSSMYIRNRI